MSLDLKKIKKIASQVQRSLFKNTQAMTTGFFKTHFRGSGLQFREHQIYEPGDDVRFIDWKLSAKMRRTYVKTFEEERNIEIDVVIDLTPSMLMGYGKISKLQAAVEIAAMLGLIAERTKDRVRGIILAAKVEETQKGAGQKFIVSIVKKFDTMGLFNETGDIDRNIHLQSSDDAQRATVIRRLLSGKRQVLYLSDWSETNMSSIKPFMARKNFHPVRLVIPLDEASSLPYSLFVGVKNKSQFLYKQKMNREEQDQVFDKKIVRIDLSKNYLFDFIHQMRKR